MEAKFKNFLGYFSKNVINRKKVILPSAIEAYSSLFPPFLSILTA